MSKKLSTKSAKLTAIADMKEAMKTSHFDCLYLGWITTTPKALPFSLFEIEFLSLSTPNQLVSY